MKQVVPFVSRDDDEAQHESTEELPDEKVDTLDGVQEGTRDAYSTRNESALQAFDVEDEPMWMKSLGPISNTSSKPKKKGRY